MICYEYFYNGSLLIAKFVGGIDKYTLISFMEFIYTRTNVEALDRILVDYRTAVLLFTDDDLKEISLIREKLVKRPNTNVTLVDTPKPTAMATMIHENYYPKHTNYHICSSLECCIRLLKLEIRVAELNTMIKGLEFKFEG